MNIRAFLTEGGGVFLSAGIRAQDGVRHGRDEIQSIAMASQAQSGFWAWAIRTVAVIVIVVVLGGLIYAVILGDIRDFTDVREWVAGTKTRYAPDFRELAFVRIDPGQSTELVLLELGQPLDRRDAAWPALARFTHLDLTLVMDVTDPASPESPVVVTEVVPDDSRVEPPARVGMTKETVEANLGMPDAYEPISEIWMYTAPDSPGASYMVRWVLINKRDYRVIRKITGIATD